MGWDKGDTSEALDARESALRGKGHVTVKEHRTPARTEDQASWEFPSNRSEKPWRASSMKMASSFSGTRTTSIF